MIVLMALRKEPERRYASAALFADDLRRHLHGRPVSARADSTLYRLGKFARQHAAAVAALDAAGLETLARHLDEWGTMGAVDRFNLDGLLALWHPAGTN